jgi:hypothetical protein
VLIEFYVILHNIYIILHNKSGFTVKAGGEVFTEVEDAARTSDSVSRWEDWR